MKARVRLRQRNHSPPTKVSSFYFLLMFLVLFDCEDINVKPFVDGQDYFEALYNAIKRASNEMYLATPFLLLWFHVWCFVVLFFYAHSFALTVKVSCVAGSLVILTYCGLLLTIKIPTS